MSVPGTTEKLAFDETASKMSISHAKKQCKNSFSAN
jgi:hypothetical protein